MAYFANASRTIVIKASRETLGLVVAASAMTFAIAYAVHSKPTPPAAVVVPQQQAWTGDLAELAPQTVVATETLRSADLVVPKSQLALPVMPSKMPPKRGCDDGPCAKTPVPPRRAVAHADEPAHVGRERVEDQGLMTTLNPMHHLPSMATIGKPFTYAGNVVTGWFRRL